MLLKMKKRGRSLLGLFLTVAIIAGVSIIHFSVQTDMPVKAADAGPSYEAGKDTLYEVKGASGGTYQDGTLTIPSENSAKILSNTPVNAAYYFSMKIQTSSSQGFNWYSRSGGNLLHIEPAGYSLGDVISWTNSTAFMNLANGLRITVYSATNRTTVWVEGQKVIDTPVTEAGEIAPQVAWTFSGEVTVSEMQMWTADSAVPQYNPEKQLLYDVQGSEGGTYDTETGILTIPSQKDAVIATEMPSASSYYCTMTLENEGNMEIQFRAGGSYLELTPFFYRIFDGEGTPKTEQIADDRLANLSSLYATGDPGIKITVYSSTSVLRIWLGEDKIFDDSVVDEGAARPSVLWSFGETKVSDVEIWTDQVVLTDEPVYSETTDLMKFSNNILSVSSGQTANLYTSSIPAEDTFYVSYTVTSDGACWLYNRGNHGRLLLQSNWWGIYSNENEVLASKSGATGLAQGIKITYCVEPNRISMWMNGEKVVEQLGTANAEGILENPHIYGNGGTTTLKDIKVWTKKAIISGSSATLEGNIKFSFFLNFDESVTEEDKEKAKVRFVLLNGKVQELTFAQAEENTAYGYRFSCKLPAKEMADEVRVLVYYDGVKSQEYKYSVMQYAMALLTQTSDTDMQKLVKTMLNYGAYAQQYFRYHVSTLANAELDSSEQGLLETVDISRLEGFAFQPLTSTDIIRLEDISLLLKSETTLRLYFTYAEGVAKEDLKVNSETCTPVLGQDKDGNYYIAVENIAADKLGDMHTITIRNEKTGTEENCTVGALTYGYYALKGSSKESLHSLVRALYLYNQAAMTCIER